MDAMKRRAWGFYAAALAAQLATGCGTYDNPYDPKNADADFDDDGIPNKDDKEPKKASKETSSGGSGGETAGAETSGTSGGTTTTSGTTPSSTTSTDGSVSLAFQHKKLEGVTYINSAAVRGTTFYLHYSTANEGGPYRIGVVDNSGLASSYAVSDLADDNDSRPLQSSTKYKIAALPSGTRIAIGQGYGGKEADTTAWNIVSAFDDTCLDISKFSCIGADGLIHTVDEFGSRTKCNASTGAQVASEQFARNEDTKHPWASNNWKFGSCSKDGGYLLHNSGSGALVEYSSSFAVKKAYSLSNYGYSPLAVVETTNGLVIIGCTTKNYGTCYISTGVAQ